MFLEYTDPPKDSLEELRKALSRLGALPTFSEWAAKDEAKKSRSTTPGIPGHLVLSQVKHMPTWVSK